MYNSMIAKLLAKENISVEHGNYRTAFFDVEKRVLGLPLWKDMGKDVYDLLVGHEVGHALETPADGWHESTKEIPGCPRSYINIVEDIRIEKLVQRRYPGLVGSFKRGYKTLDQQDFFGIADKPIELLHLADRINIKAKLRDLVDVPFAANESDIVKQVFAVETWDDVIAACKALYEFIEENKDEQPNQETPSTGQASDDSDEMESNPSSGSDSDADADGEESEDQQDGPGKPDGSPSDEESESDNESGSAEPSDENNEVKEEEKSDSPVTATGAGDFYEDDHQSITDESFRNREDELLDTDARGRMKDVVKAVTREQAYNMVVPYKEVFAARDEANSTFTPFDETHYNLAVKGVESALVKFKSDTKKFVGLMAKEFEMRKAAYRTLRAQTARSGSLDMTKLHTYKYNDDIFAKVTNLADAKSHGMVMFIDYSGSMGSVIHDVVKQTLTLAEFCKKVGIPFDVYTFTSGSNRKDRIATEGMVNTEYAQIVHVLSSSMTKAEYLRGFNELFSVSKSTYYGNPRSKVDDFGGTPLNEVIMASDYILTDFKKKYNVQKVNAIFLTDGDAQYMYINRAHTGNESSGAAINFRGKLIDARMGNRGMTAELLNCLRKDFEVIGYFICENTYNFKGKIWDIGRNRGDYIPQSEMSAYRKQFNKNKFVSFDGVIGYDKFFILKADKGALNTEDDELEISENAKKGEIQRAFKKHANSKKANKILASQFAQMVA